MLAVAGCAAILVGGAGSVLADPVARVVIQDDGTANGILWVEQDGAHYCGQSGYYWVGPNYSPDSADGALLGTSSDCDD